MQTVKSIMSKEIEKVNIDDSVKDVAKTMATKKIGSVLVEHNGNLIGIMEAIDEDDIMLITDRGIMIRQPVSNIRTIGRNTQGVRLAKLDDKTYITSATRVLKEDEDNEEEEAPEPEE